MENKIKIRYESSTNNIVLTREDKEVRLFVFNNYSEYKESKNPNLHQFDVSFIDGIKFMYELLSMFELEDENCVVSKNFLNSILNSLYNGPRRFLVTEDNFMCEMYYLLISYDNLFKEKKTGYTRLENYINFKKLTKDIKLTERFINAIEPTAEEYLFRKFISIICKTKLPDDMFIVYTLNWLINTIEFDNDENRGYLRYYLYNESDLSLKHGYLIDFVLLLLELLTHGNTTLKTNSLKVFSVLLKKAFKEMPPERITEVIIAESLEKYVPGVSDLNKIIQNALFNFTMIYPEIKEDLDNSNFINIIRLCLSTDSDMVSWNCIKSFKESNWKDFNQFAISMYNDLIKNKFTAKSKIVEIAKPEELISYKQNYHITAFNKIPLMMFIKVYDNNTFQPQKKIYGLIPCNQKFGIIEWKDETFYTSTLVNDKEYILKFLKANNLTFGG